MIEKMHLCIFPIFDHFKIFENVPTSLVKFDEEDDGEVAEPIQPTVLELRPDFVQKWGPEHAKIVVSQFSGRIPIRRPQKSPSRRYLQIG